MPCGEVPRPFGGLKLQIVCARAFPDARAAELVHQDHPVAYTLSAHALANPRADSTNYQGGSTDATAHHGGNL